MMQMSAVDHVDVMQYTASFNDTHSIRSFWNCQNGTFSVPTGNSSLVDIVMMVGQGIAGQLHAARTGCFEPEDAALLCDHV